MKEVPSRWLNVHVESFSILSRLSVARSHLERNDLLANQQAWRVLDDLIQEIEQQEIGNGTYPEPQ